MLSVSLSVSLSLWHTEMRSDCCTYVITERFRRTPSRVFQVGTQDASNAFLDLFFLVSFYCVVTTDGVTRVEFRGFL